MGKCETCRWWSETCAQSIGCGPIEALCENEHSPKFMVMTGERSGCDKYERNEGAPDAR